MIKEKFDLGGKIAVVTGAGRGPNKEKGNDTESDHGTV